MQNNIRSIFKRDPLSDVMRGDFLVLGATGMQGHIVTRDLIENGHYTVVMAGRDKSRVEPYLKKYKNKVSFEYVDLRNVKQTAEVIKKSGAKVVVNCAEGDWNLNALEASIQAGAHCIDLGSEIWMTKKQFDLAPQLKKKGLVHITGCGSVPGVGNVMLRYAANKFDKVKDVEVGFAWDSNIKEFVVPFSIQSIIEEFSDPAPVILHKKMITVKPLDSIIECAHRTINKEKCFYVRHPETYTFYRFLKHKGINNVRFYAGFPEHSFQKIKTLIDLGFGSKEKVKVDGKEVVPVEVLTEVLKRIKTPKGYKEHENLWVELNNGKKKIKMECLVPTLKGWEDAGCNIDTGMPASIMAQMIFKNMISEPGSYAPEDIVPPEPFFKELAKRNMKVLENGRQIN